MKFYTKTLDYSVFKQFWYFDINILNIAGASWFLSLPKIYKKEKSCWMKEILSDFLAKFTYWIISMNFEPLSGSESMSVFSALIIKSRSMQLIVVYEFLMFYTALFRISLTPFKAKNYSNFPSSRLSWKTLINIFWS